MKVAVVGGGLAGLVAANKLALGGATVTLYESSATLGGRAASDLCDGAAVNRGPHALYRSDGLRTLRGLGVHPRGSSPDLANFKFLLDGRCEPAPTSAWNAARAGYLTWGDRLTVGRFFAAVFRLDPTEWDDRPFSDLIEMFEGSPPTQQIVRWLGMLSTYGNSPRMSAGVVLRQVRASFSGVIYVDDGWQSMVDELATKAVERGVQVELESPIATVSDLADNVVLAVPPRVVERLTGRDFGPRETTRMASLDLVIPNPSRPLHPLFDIDRGVYLAVFPNGIVHCAKYLDPHAIPPADVVRADIELVLDAGYPAWREDATTQRYLPKIAVNHWFPDFEIGGLRGRPRVQLDEHTFIAGDWVGDAGLLADAAILSGAKAAELVLTQHERNAA